MSSKRAYAGNCRMIEIGSLGQPFRLLMNVDRIENIRFEEQFAEHDVPVPGTGKDAFTDRGGVEQPAVPPDMRKQVVSTGWGVIISQNGQQSGLTLPDMQAAMNCYNSIVGMINAVGVPNISMPPLVIPPAASPIVDVDGEKIKEAVDAADLHPDLAGGDGAGMAENDDDGNANGKPLEGQEYVPSVYPDDEEDFELTDEDLELLENPVIDEGELDEAFASPEDPPTQN